MKEKKEHFTWLSMVTLIIFTAPIVLGYLWLFISTFSERTYGLKPVDVDGNFGGFTLKNWAFLSEPDIWLITLNTFLLAFLLTLGVLLVSSMGGLRFVQDQLQGAKVSPVHDPDSPCLSQRNPADRHLLRPSFYLGRSSAGIPVRIQYHRRSRPCKHRPAACPWESG